MRAGPTAGAGKIGISSAGSFNRAAPGPLLDPNRFGYKDPEEDRDLGLPLLAAAFVI